MATGIWWLKIRLRDVALNRAVSAGDSMAVRQLLAQGANPNTDATYGYNFTPLRIAAAQGDTQIMNLLLDAGANINAQDNDGWTPLWDAALAGRLQAVELLVKRGADLHLQDRTYRETVRTMITEASQHTPEAVRRFHRQRRPLYAHIIQMLRQAERKQIQSNGLQAN